MRTDDYLALDFQDNMILDPQTRRDFLKRLGGGIFIFVALGDWTLGQEAGRQRGGRGLPSDFNAFLRIGEDGRVTCFTGKIEMGQGPITSLPQMLAEELDVPLNRVDIVMGDTERCPWDMGTFGSQTTRSFGPALQAAAAEARAVLLELAAETLKVPPAQLVAKDGAVYDAQNKEQRLTYAQLAKGQRIKRQAKPKPALKPASAHTVVGRPQLRRDSRDKVTGRAQYAGDLREPGMLYAKVLKPPAHGAKLKSVDTTAAKAIAGVRVVEEGDLVAVLHELPDVAEAALEKVKAEFEVPEPSVDDKTIFEHLLKANPQGRSVAEGGDLPAGRKLASKTFEQTYFNSYVAHAAMETHTALAKVEGDKATIWASTQNPFGAQREIAEAIGMPLQSVRVIAPFVGGRFRRQDP
jgi:nicotinate dehydrogenase subunit B